MPPVRWGGGGSRWNSATPFRKENYNGLATTWWKHFEDIFIRFGATHERDRRTVGRTDRHRVPAIAALCIASHGKKRLRVIHTKAFEKFGRSTLTITGITVFTSRQSFQHTSSVLIAPSFLSFTDFLRTQHVKRCTLRQETTHYCQVKSSQVKSSQVKSSQVAFNKQVTIAPVLQKYRIMHT